MKQIACIGTEAFTLGFKMTGVKTIDYDKERFSEQLSSLTDDTSIGIVIIEEALLSLLEGDARAEIEDSVSPVFFTLSSEENFEAIRKLIIKSIGVDLWKGD